MPADDLAGAFDAARLAVDAVGGAQNELVVLEFINLGGAEVGAGVDAELLPAAVIFAVFGSVPLRPVSPAGRVFDESPTSRTE